MWRQQFFTPSYCWNIIRKYYTRTYVYDNHGKLYSENFFKFCIADLLFRSMNVLSIYCKCCFGSYLSYEKWSGSLGWTPWPTKPHQAWTRPCMAQLGYSGCSWGCQTFVSVRVQRCLNFTHIYPYLATCFNNHLQLTISLLVSFLGYINFVLLQKGKGVWRLIKGT